MSKTAFIEEIAAHVRKYAPLYGIRVYSPIIAQAVLESGGGQSELARNANNYFGLKWRANRCPTASGYYIKVGSEQNSNGSYISSEMKWFKFPDMEAGVQGYFDFINNANYAALKGVTDPETYLRNIKAAGYATSLKYVDNLLNVIKSYDLTKYDNAESERMYKVCIDAGHFGKYNRSPGIPEYYESEIMWKLHLLQVAHLEKLGIEVVTTRSNQEKDLALQARGKAAAGCDLFISNHSNAVGSGMNEAVDYAAIYHLVSDATTNADEISAEFAKGIAPIIAEVMGTKQGYKVLTRKAGNDRNKDGVLNDNYYGVLHGARLVNVPGLILEHSFHTNSRAVKWLLASANLDRLAKAEAEYIAGFLKGNKGANTSAGASTPGTPAGASNLPYFVKIKADSLNVRAGAGTRHKINTVVRKGEVYTITATSGSWGRLKSGAGWINLKYTKRV